MNVTVTFPESQVPRWVQNVFHDQVPFANKVALNETAKIAQTAMQTRVLSVFEARRPNWLKLGQKIKPFATKERQEVRLLVDPPGDRDDELSQHEADPRKRPIQGRSIAVPTEHVPRTASGVIRSGWRPRDVLKRNFKDGFRAFLQRGKGRKRAIWWVENGRLLPLYWLVPSVPLDQRLQFVETVSKKALEVFPDQFVRAFDRAIRTAR